MGDWFRCCKTGAHRFQVSTCTTPVAGTSLQQCPHSSERYVFRVRSRRSVLINDRSLSGLPRSRNAGCTGHVVGDSFDRLHKAPPQSLTARQQTVVGVRERKRRKEGEGLPATGAATSPDPDPVVVCIVRLLATASVADDQIASTNRASPQDGFGAVRRPIGFELVWRVGKWDKRNRSLLELSPGH